MSQNKQSNLKRVLQYLICILVSLVVSFIIIDNYHPVLVDGESMMPTFKNGDLLISTTTFDYIDIKIGDIVVFKNNIQMIKRVIAKGGDEIWVTDGKVYVNGELSPYQFEPIESAGVLSNVYTVKDNELFCMGDNRNNSLDCRSFGAISFEQIKYKIIKKIKIFNK